MMRQAVEPTSFPWLDTGRYTFSLAIEAADATWLSGQTASAYQEETGRVGVVGGAGRQAALCWDKIDSVVAAAGRSVGDCTELVEYVTADGLAQREAIEAARPTTGGPASLMVVESLVRPEAVVEVEVVAGAPPGLKRLPQLLPIDDQGKVVAPGDLAAQGEWLLEEAGRQLAAVGLDLDHVVRVVQQTTPATRREYGTTADARRRLLGPVFPASTGVLVSRLPHPEVLVALDVWAAAGGKAVVPYATEAYAPLTFSPATVADGVVFISGTTAWDPATGDTVAPNDIVAQAEYIYGEIAKVCEAAGGSLDNVVKTIEYITPDGLDRYRQVGAVRESVMARPHPASTGVVVAGLLSRKWQIEVEAVAVLR